MIWKLSNWNLPPTSMTSVFRIPRNFTQPCALSLCASSPTQAGSCFYMADTFLDFSAQKTTRNTTIALKREGWALISKAMDRCNVWTCLLACLLCIISMDSSDHVSLHGALIRDKKEDYKKHHQCLQRSKGGPWSFRKWTGATFEPVCWHVYWPGHHMGSIDHVSLYGALIRQKEQE